ncbi:MAG: hypothetical protein HC812_05500 [Leptolyngbya sp. RL_3_1]|nr:hypothetical protein [Leptolyngbya sp. RL_3_1]
MPFQSRLFNATIRQVRHWQDRVGHLWRQAQLRATWGIEALLYPFTQLTQALTQRVAKHRDQAFGAAAQRSPSLAFSLRVRRLFKGRQVAITLVRRTTAWLGHLGSPFQKFSTPLVLRRSDQPRKANQPSRALANPIADSRALVSTQIAPFPQAIWSWIKAAMVYFFGQDDCGQSLKALFPFSGRIFPEPESVTLGLPATSLSMVLLPGVENLVRAVLRVIRRGIQAIAPWVWGDRAAVPLPPVDLPPPVPLAPSQQFERVADSLFSPVAGPLLQTDGPHWDDLRRMDFEPTTTLIDVKATVLGYVEPPLRMIWAALDRVVRWLEDGLIAGLHGLWQLVQRVTRYGLTVLGINHHQRW